MRKRHSHNPASLDQAVEFWQPVKGIGKSLALGDGLHKYKSTFFGVYSVRSCGWN